MQEQRPEPTLDQSEVEDRMAQIREELGQRRPKDYPLAKDPNGFGRWLRTQIHRQDRVGALARVATQDPTWPSPETRRETMDYFVRMGARSFVRQTVTTAWDEYDRLQKRQANRAKNKAVRAARKANRKRRR